MSSPAQSYPAAVLAGGEYAARIIGPADARSLVPAWRELALKAMEPNVFYEPDFVLAAEPAFAAPGRLQFLTINRGESLVFLLPFRTVGAGAMMIAEAFRHPYATTTAPLVAASDARQALHLWLSGGAAQIRVSGWRLQEMPQDGALWQAMMEDYLLERETLAMVLVLVDGEIGPTRLDLQMLEWVRANALPHVVIATKHDKVKSSRRQRRKRDLAEACRLQPQDGVWVSAAKGTGIDRLRGLVREWLAPG